MKDRESNHNSKWKSRSVDEVEIFLSAESGTLEMFKKENFQYDSHFVIAIYSLFESGVREVAKALTNTTCSLNEVWLPENRQPSEQIIRALINDAKNRNIPEFTEVAIAIEGFYNPVSKLRNRYAHGFKNIHKSIPTMLTDMRYGNTFTSGDLWENLFDALKALVHLGNFDQEQLQADCAGEAAAIESQMDSYLD
jgi:hypothetical protein